MEKYFRELTRNIRLDHDTATAPYPPHFHDSIEVIMSWPARKQPAAAVLPIA